MNKSERRIWNNRIRRQKQLRRNKCLAFFTACLIITVSFTAGGFRANAESDGKERMFKYYKSVLIDSGDTLWSIAVENKTPGTDTEDVVEEIKKINGLHSDGITSGNYLIVPYYSKEFRSST